MLVATKPVTKAPPARGWLARNWKWFLPATFAAAVVLAAIAAFGYVQIRSYRYRQNPAYQAAVAEVQTNKQLQERLGQPIVDSDWMPQGAIDVRDDASIGEARFNFTISGPQGTADVNAEGRMVDAEWALSRLEVLFDDGERVRLSEQVRAKQKHDTPAFDLQKEQQRQAKKDEQTHNEPAPEVNVEIPQLPPELK
jgi:hypothetical protein